MNVDYNASRVTIKRSAEMHEVIKEVFVSMFEAILNGELENYLGYESNSKVQTRRFRD